MKTYIICVIVGSFLFAIGFVLLISGQNLGEDFYRIEDMVDGSKVEFARLDQFALFIASFAIWPIAVLVVPVVAIRCIITVIEWLKAKRSQRDER